MKQNPYLDAMFPPKLDAEAIRKRYAVLKDITPDDQFDYFAAVLLSLPNCPSDIRQELLNG